MAKENQPNFKRTATLLQAARFVAWGLSPLEERLEKIEGYPQITTRIAGLLPYSIDRGGLPDGARQLLKFLSSGTVIASGYPLSLAKPIPPDPYSGPPQLLFDTYSGFPDEGKFAEFNDPLSSKPIPAQDWDMERINWITSFIWDPHLSEESRGYLYFAEPNNVAAYTGVSIKMSELRSAMEANEQLPAHNDIPTQSQSYRSPFVSLILRAEEHFGERLMSAKKAEIEEWLSLEGPKIDPAWSRNKTRMMATFLRTPEKQKGGNKKIS